MRVLIVDDNAVFRACARRLLMASGMVVVGEAATGARGLVLAARLRPDVVLLDVQLPDMGGFDVCGRLCRIGLVVVLCSVRDYTGHIAASGARGFVRKERLSGQELERLLLSVGDR